MFRQQKKGQAAMEFLMTYGWAILVVLAAIGALAYFGVLSPEKLVPERTQFTAPFPSSESAVVSLGTKTVQVALSNNLGQTVELVETATSSGDCTGLTTVIVTKIDGAAPAGNLNVSNGESFILEWTCPTFAGADGDRFEAELGFTYVTASGLVKTHSGTVSGMVKP